MPNPIVVCQLNSTLEDVEKDIEGFRNRLECIETKPKDSLSTPSQHSVSTDSLSPINEETPKSTRRSYSSQLSVNIFLVHLSIIIHLNRSVYTYVERSEGFT